jgi:hypothetical protein
MLCAPIQPVFSGPVHLTAGKNRASSLTVPSGRCRASTMSTIQVITMRSG